MAHLEQTSAQISKLLEAFSSFWPFLPGCRPSRREKSYIFTIILSDYHTRPRDLFVKLMPRDLFVRFFLRTFFRESDITCIITVVGAQQQHKGMFFFKRGVRGANFPPPPPPRHK